MSAKATKRPLRSMTAHEKLDAIRRVHDGESKASVARDIGVPESTLRGWCKNEDKISYLSRQSSPETDESLDYPSQISKKIKIDDVHPEPFNLSMKTTSNNCSTYEDSNKLPLPSATTDSSTPKSINSLSERERNRAELARLSVELGLNRPERFLPNLTNSLSLTDFSTNISLLAQWNALLAQQQQLKALQTNKSTKHTEVSSSNSVLSSIEQSQHQEQSQLNLPKMQESVWYWLKSQQSVLNVNQIPTTSSTSNGVSSNPLPSSSTITPTDQSSWFWKWYKQIAYKEQETNNILYQQLTKEIAQKEQNTPTTSPLPDLLHQSNAENLTTMREPEEAQKENDKSAVKVRSVLDNLLFNNNNNDNSTTEKRQAIDEDDALSQSEAVEHGEKFLKWLESCSDPSVTAVQIMQFKTLLNNVKTGADRKNSNSDCQNKTKVKRK